MENNKKDRAVFAAILQSLIINSSVKYRTTEEEKAVFKFYFEALKHLEIDEIGTAAKEILKTWKWNRLPTVAEILENVPGQKLTQIEDRARVQAQLVIKVLRTQGANATPAWKDPLTRWIMSNRWPYQEWASQVLESELHWWERDFVNLYTSLNQGEGEKHLDFTPRKAIESGDKVKSIGQILPKQIEGLKHV